MALSRRSSNRFHAAIWPGFVDAMTGLLLVLMFVLTIFMVIQFVLRETITGQENKLSLLAEQVASLTQALGLEQTRSASLGSQVGQLTTSLSEATDKATQAEALIASLTAERDATAAALSDASSRITGFEAQVAGLLAQRSDLQTQVAGLQADQARAMSDQEALNLALAQARTEVDAGAEAARLAAARREALEALVAQLQSEGASSGERISDLEAARIADAAAAEALQARLQDATTELTAMTLSLEEQRKQAEDTLTLLAAANAARDDLAARLAQGEAEKTDLTTRLAAAVAAGESANTDLVAARAALDQALQDRALSEQEIQARLTAALAEMAAAREATQTQMTEAERQAALLATAQAELTKEQALSADGQRQVALLNEQVAQLRAQVGDLRTQLGLAEETDRQNGVQIENLSAQLNTAALRELAERNRRLALEEAERQRLEAEKAQLEAQAKNLEQYRSEFFGQLRDVLAGQDGIRIEGDRFVFSSEVLFDAGQATLSDAGKAEIAKVAAILKSVAIPDSLNWIIRVDGHTDNVPLSGAGQYRNNWELSQARALSVVLFLIDQEGIDPTRLSANGFGEYQPVNPDDTPEARAQNRRIELKLTEK